ncbi:MAG: hypothetical protein JWR38_5973 [Mucilaginibacter sp.]|nr:hypothetical protein [Mucilaginibacter sp.]
MRHQIAQACIRTSGDTRKDAYTVLQIVNKQSMCKRKLTKRIGSQTLCSMMKVINQYSIIDILILVAASSLVLI